MRRTRASSFLSCFTHVWRVARGSYACILGIVTSELGVASRRAQAFVGSRRTGACNGGDSAGIPADGNDPVKPNVAMLHPMLGFGFASTRT